MTIETRRLLGRIRRLSVELERLAQGRLPAEQHPQVAGEMLAVAWALQGEAYWALWPEVTA